MRFTSKEKLVEFLGMARRSRVATAIRHRTSFWIYKNKVKHHGRFADRVLKVTDVPAGGENGGRLDIFVVLVGAAGYIQAYNGIRRHPNVVFEAIPSKGPNSSFVSVKVKTPNGVGILAERVPTKNELAPISPTSVGCRLLERIHSLSLPCE